MNEIMNDLRLAIGSTSDRRFKEILGGIERFHENQIDIEIIVVRN